MVNNSNAVERFRESFEHLKERNSKNREANAVTNAKVSDNLKILREILDFKDLSQDDPMYKHYKELNAIIDLDRMEDKKYAKEVGMQVQELENNIERITEEKERQLKAELGEL